MTHRIIVEGPTPHETIATLSALAAPHVINGVKLQMQREAHLAATAATPLPKTGPQELPAGPTPSMPSQELLDQAAAAAVEGAKAAGLVATVAADTPDVGGVKPARRPRAAKRDTTKDKTAVNIDDPHGKAHTYETVGEALEGMCDMLDLCTTVAEVDEWVGKHEGLIAGAGQPGEVFRGIVNGFKTELQSTDTSDFPATDVVGEKKTAAQPAEMSLDDPLAIPAALKREKVEDKTTLVAQDVRNAFLAMCEVKGAPSGRALLDEYKVARVSKVPEAKWGDFVAACVAKKAG